MKQSDKHTDKQNIPTRYEISPFQVEGVTKKAKIYLSLDRNNQINPVYQVDANLHNLKGKLGRVRKSTGKADKKLALKEAKQIVQEEYSYRISYGETRKNLGNDALFEEYIEHIRELTKLGRPMRKGNWNADNFKKHRGNITKHIVPHFTDKPLKLTNKLDIENWVEKLRSKGVSDKTISNVKTTFNYVWDYAEVRGIVDGQAPKFPTLKSRQIKNGVEWGYGYASTEQVREAIHTIKQSLKSNELTDNQRHKRYVCMHWFIILLNTGMRPYINTPLRFKEHSRTKTKIFFNRFEKGLRYTAYGQKEAMQSVDELNAYYKDMGINNEELIVGLDGKKLTSKSYELLWKDVKGLIGWDTLTDDYGRPLVPYSIRHCHITYCLRNGEPPHSIAKRCGTSVDMIMKHYYEHDFFNETETPTP